ncbi:hypothetical protein E8P82_04935 [Arthrobacter echini]|uniref:DUF2238 domain-containing protein n=1 Tax=Arthrobacter echini TaxID=1529066 RepID=A0A4S5E774_9MICC|nr:hypothetical protein [Arthrobacter echini]THJ67447.1 hypothetical protein E8P82_04935 [Arthrobacter echini]
MRSLPEVSSRRGNSRGTSRWIADAVRLLALLSAVVGAFSLGFPQTFGLAIMALGLLFSRMFRLPAPVDAVFCTTIFVATWSGMLGLYRTVPSWDLVVHFATIGAVSAALYLVVAGWNVTREPGSGTPARAVVILTFSLGMTVAVLWEFGEWIAHRYFTDVIIVGYDDSMGDMAVGGVGAALAGFVLAYRGGAAGETAGHGPSGEPAAEQVAP